MMVLLAAAASTGPALASERSDLYFGVGIGQATIDTDLSSGQDFDASDLAWKGVIGYNFVVNPYLDLALETGYRNLGEPDDDNVEIDVDGLEVFAVISLNLGRFGIFGKAGLIDWDSEINAGGPQIEDDGTDPIYGVGASMRSGSWQFRGEAEKLDIEDVDDVYMISASVLYAY